MIHILVVRDTKFWVVGPFDNEDDASNYGHAHYAPGGPDDPRWQTIELRTEYKMVGAACYSPAVAYTIPDDEILDNFAV